MRRYEEYLATIDTIYPDQFQREFAAYVAANLVPAQPMPVRAGFITGLIDVVGNWLQRRKGRHSLTEMSIEQLADIGITRVAANREAAKSRFLA